MPSVAPDDVIADKLVQTAGIGVVDPRTAILIVVDRYLGDLEANISAHLVDEFPQEIGHKLLLCAETALLGFFAGASKSSA
jgi:hypothetical protein